MAFRLGIRVFCLFLATVTSGQLVSDTGEPLSVNYPADWFDILENETGPPDWFTQLPGYECSLNPRWPGETRFPFECPLPAPHDSSYKRPTSVHRLRPSDINVIGALGDSITSANGAGACFLPEVLYMYKGQCFSTGGDGSFESNPTLAIPSKLGRDADKNISADIVRKFNPELKGYSLETNWWTSPQSGMNVGIPGAIADDMPEQARAIIRAMRDDPNIDFENDWKLVTIFIGGNDLCGWCRRKDQRTAEKYTKWIQDAIQILHDGLPRTHVAVVGILLIPELDIMNRSYCTFMHNQYCSCAMDLSIRDEFWAITRDYQVTLQAMIESGIFDDKEDFTASLLPCLHNSHMPILPDGSPDYSLFSPDCFHFSHKGHSGFGALLWNNLLEKVGERTDDYANAGDLKCPSQASPYIYTNVNSKPGYKFEDDSAATSWNPSLIIVAAAALLVLL